MFHAPNFLFLLSSKQHWVKTIVFSNEYPSFLRSLQAALEASLRRRGGAWQHNHIISKQTDCLDMNSDYIYLTIVISTCCNPARVPNPCEVDPKTIDCRSVDWFLTRIAGMQKRQLQGSYPSGAVRGSDGLAPGSKTRTVVLQNHSGGSK
jgi:hypothetical protein